MTYSIALSGAHRVGKTAITQMFESLPGYKAIQCNTSEAFKALNFSPKAELNPLERLMVQQYLVNHLEKLYKRPLIPFSHVIVYDRSPLDYAAYTLYHLGKYEEFTGYVNNLVKRYLGMMQYIDRVYLLQPGIEFSFAPTSADYDLDMMNEITDIIKSLALADENTGKVNIIPETMTGYYNRIQHIIDDFKEQGHGFHIQHDGALDSKSESHTADALNGLLAATAISGPQSLGLTVNRCYITTMQNQTHTSQLEDFKNAVSTTKIK